MLTTKTHRQRLQLPSSEDEPRCWSYSLKVQIDAVSLSGSTLIGSGQLIQNASLKHAAKTVVNAAPARSNLPSTRSCGFVPFLCFNNLPVKKQSLRHTTQERQPRAIPPTVSGMMMEVTIRQLPTPAPGSAATLSTLPAGTRSAAQCRTSAAPSSIAWPALPRRSPRP
jgi:hypothetical protein